MKTINDACAALGWVGSAVGPVRFGGVTFWAAMTEQSGQLHGCLVVGRTPTESQRQASLLAPYTPRAVILPESTVTLAAVVDAAVLDQGLLVQASDGSLTVVASPGPRSWTGRTTAREMRFLEEIRAA